MEVPPITNKKWKEILNDEKDYKFKSLAVRILLARLKINVKYARENKVTIIDKSTMQLRELFVTLIKLPTVQEDLNQIFKGV